MRLNHLLHADLHRVFIDILNECEEFLCMSGVTPLQKALPASYDDVQRVKVRKRKSESNFNANFNEAFVDEVRELRQRAIFANDAEVGHTDEEMFYIFPPNGFSFLYSPEVTNSTEQYRTVFETVLDTLDDQAALTFQDLLKFTYKSDNLKEGIESGAEIIIFNTPFYYAIKQNTYPDYEELLSLVQEK